MLLFILGGAMDLYGRTRMTKESGASSRWYLNVIITLLMVFMALIAWTMQDALARNDQDHEVIKDDLKELSGLVLTFVQNAPPNHIHLPDGTCARILTPD
jgi:hypothetical protein